MTKIQKIGEFGTSELNLLSSIIEEEFNRLEYWSDWGLFFKISYNLPYIRREWKNDKKERIKRYKNSIDIPIKLMDIIGKKFYKIISSELSTDGNFKFLSVPSTPEAKYVFTFFPNDELIWCFKGYAYNVKGILTDEEKILLIFENYDSERKKFERLKNKFGSKEAQQNSHSRQPIPESVRIAVWRRDGGKCTKCGSRENLEYDHIIPISKGGGNSVRNIELLCEKCNRSKSNKIE